MGFLFLDSPPRGGVMAVLSCRDGRYMAVYHASGAPTLAGTCPAPFLLFYYRVTSLRTLLGGFVLVHGFLPSVQVQ